MLEREAVTVPTQRLLDAARTGRGGALFILGDAGLGKTVCLDAACDAATGLRIGRGRADPMASMLPFGLMTQVLEDLDGRHLLGVQAREVSPLDARAGWFFAVLNWLESLSGNPVLLSLDDLHWADPDSLALLSFLVRRISSLPVAVIGTLRPWPSAAQELAAALMHDAGAELTELAPLSEHAAGVLLAGLTHRRLPDQVVTDAWHACAGNPLLLQQVAAVLERGENVSRLLERGGRRLAERLLLARFAGLPAAGLRIARAAGILGGRFRAEFAVQIAGVPDEETDAALDALARSGLIRAATGGGLEFVHPLFRQALYEDTSAPLRTRLHSRAFRLLHARGMDAQATEHALRGELAGLPEAIAVLEESGRSALASGALEVAADHLGGAVELAGDRADPELLMAWGEASLGRGRPADALTAAERVLARMELPVPLRVRALELVGRVHAVTGAHDRAALVYEQAAALAETPHPELAAEVLLDHALSSWLAAGPARALPLVSRASALAAGSGQELRARADVAWGFIALQAGEPGGLGRIAELAGPLLADAAADIADLSDGMTGTLTTYASCTILAEQLAACDTATGIILAAAERLGALQTLASAANIRSHGLFRMGRLDEALELIGRTRELTEFFPMIEPYMAARHAYILLHLGRVEEVEAWCVRAERPAQAHREWTALMSLCDVRGQVRLREGDITVASDLYREAEEIGDRMGVGEPCLVPWARHAIAAHIGADRPDDAARVIDWLERCTVRLPCRWPRIGMAVGRAWLAEQDGHREKAEEHFDRALSLHNGLDLPLERVETLLDYGAFLRRAGKTGHARELLAQAGEVAAGSGALWLAALASRELSVAGGRRRRRRDPDRLTPQEERVAQQVATGKSNTELAHQLSVSVNTIETHLRHIYAKLGVRSRLELAAYLADRDAPGTAAEGHRKP